ncbi:MAG: DNA alkylation repair protein [Owenweeksia sp.]
MSAVKDIRQLLQAEANPTQAKSLDHFGVAADKAFGIRLPVLRKTAKEVGKDHELALALWNEDYHECKLLAPLLAEPQRTTLTEMDKWVQDIYSWDVCDQLCINLLVKLEERWTLPERWAHSEEEYVRRAGLVMIVALRIHDKKAADETFEAFFYLLEKYASDERNFVKKAVNWAIRELGKRSIHHYPQMISLCQRLLETDSKPAHWIARDALRELESEKVKQRLGLED